MKAGIIGTGNIGQQHLQAILRCGIKDICLCDRNKEQTERAAALCNGTVYTDYKEMLDSEKLDFISVCTPTSSHKEIAVYALNSGVAVLCEKPFCSTVEEATAILKKAEEKRSLLMVAHCLRFAKTYAYLKNCVDDGRFGRLLALNMYRHSVEPKWSKDGWMNNNALSGGAVVDLHIHETDMAVFLLGAPYAVTTVGDYKQCATVYHYADSPIAVSAQSSWRPISTFPFASGFDANFERATVICEGNTLKVYTEAGLDDSALEKESFPYYIMDQDPYYCENRYFIDCLKTGRVPYCDPKDSAVSLKVVLAERNSFLQQKTLKIE